MCLKNKREHKTKFSFTMFSFVFNLSDLKDSIFYAERFFLLIILQSNPFRKCVNRNQCFQQKYNFLLRFLL